MNSFHAKKEIPLRVTQASESRVFFYFFWHMLRLKKKAKKLYAQEHESNEEEKGSRD